MAKQIPWNKGLTKFTDDRILHSCSKLSESLKKKYKDGEYKVSNGEKHSLAVGKGTKGKFNIKPTTIFNLSSRTISKVLHRLKISCFNCGWNECNCDIHHIISKRCGGEDVHNNITYLCPNCHRLAHNNKLNSFRSFEDVVGDRWITVYFG